MSENGAADRRASDAEYVRRMTRFRHTTSKELLEAYEHDQLIKGYIDLHLHGDLSYVQALESLVIDLRRLWRDSDALHLRQLMQKSDIVIRLDGSMEYSGKDESRDESKSKDSRPYCKQWRVSPNIPKKGKGSRSWRMHIYDGEEASRCGAGPLYAETIEAFPDQQHCCKLCEIMRPPTTH